MIKWCPVELHTHSNHSDADFEVWEIADAGKKTGFKAMSLTDHNTKSGVPIFEQACKNNDLVFVSGTEWTTYYGHMLILEEQGETCWLDVMPDDIDDAIKQIHTNNGIIGLAHPFAISDPVNTGYNWSFNIKDFSLVDYIEVYSRDFTVKKIQTDRAFALWEKLLLDGYKVSAISGRDWHKIDEKPVNYACTRLAIDGELSADAVIDALKNNRAYVSVGPEIIMDIKDANGNDVNIGDTISAEKLIFNISIDESENFDNYKQFNIAPKKISIINNSETIHQCDIDKLKEITLDVKSGFIRIEVLGDYINSQDARIAFTNAIYIR